MENTDTSEDIYRTGKELGIREGRVLERMEVEDIIREIKSRTKYERDWGAQDIFDEILEKLKNHP